MQHLQPHMTLYLDEKKLNWGGKRKGNSKISEKIKKSLYIWIMHHQQVVQSPIENDCLKVKIDGYTELQLVPNFLLNVSARELHNNLVMATKDGGIKEARDEDENNLISNSKLRLLLPPQLKKFVKIQGHVWL